MSEMSTVKAKTENPKLRSFWSCVSQKYKLKRVMGRGAYGEVVQAKRRLDGEIVAIKLIVVDLQSPLLIQSVIREIEILKQLSAMDENVHTTKLFEVIQGKEKLDASGARLKPIFLVMEWMPSNLLEFLNSKEDINEDLVKKLLYRMLCGLNFLHSANVMHRDIKPANILMDGDFNLTFCDFGFSRTTLACADASSFEISKPSQQGEGDLKQQTQEKAPRRRLSRHVTTRYYRAPEVILLEKNYDQAIDVWSLGCILSELLVSQVPYKADKKDSVILFKGDSCYPLSPKHENSNKITSGDQLRKIMQTFGALTESDMEFISTNRGYADKLKSAEAKINFDLEFEYNSKDICDITEEMLQFNPNLRSSTRQLLENTFFNDIRDASLEVEAPFQVQISHLEDFDYAENSFTVSLDKLMGTLDNLLSFE